MPVTILKGLGSSGVTLHRLTEELDMGEILAQETFPVLERENLESFMEKANAAIRVMLTRVMADFTGFYNRAKPQEEYAREGEPREGEYWPCPGEEDWTVTVSMEPEQIDRIFRAFYGYECIFIDGDRRYELIRASIGRRPSPGQISFRTQSGHYITAEKVEEII